ncbi:RepA protein [Nitrospirillum amazonense]|uniref:RepA protein n=1 Tax=Nitrospirillum amazonense TaxID=28077 RepID=A0A560EIX6_9PROT|nr:replication protein RepA [Nitrospirillum amazonense]TWB09312.1 RepA protein [Nitrospirillum amazonense]
MGQVHQLITAHGIDAARATSTDKLERQCIDTAFAVMSDESQRVGIMHAGFAMTALPHKDLPETVWTRQGGNVRLTIESGRDAATNPVGLPFGSIARMILLYLQTEAVKTRSRDIELGRSMNQWLSSMGIDNGGKTYKLVREQSKRLSLCRLTFYRIHDTMTQVTNGSFVRDAIMPTVADDQLNLWREAVRLDEGFYQSLIDHPMPVREAAIREIGGRSMALDVYIWLAYRLHSLEKPTPVPWAALFQQFGGGFTHQWHFKSKFKEPLALALAAYPEAVISADDSGLTLYPSPPPVPYRSAITSR